MDVSAVGSGAADLLFNSNVAGSGSLAAQTASDTAAADTGQSQDSSSGESVGEQITAALYGLDGKILAAQKQMVGQLFSALA